MRHPPRRNQESDHGWIVVASRQDEDAVGDILKRARSHGIVCSRVLWTDEGPVRLYSCTEDFWRDLLPL